jgi:hypothetical protein
MKFTNRTKTAAGIAGLLLLTGPLAACGNEGDDEGGSSDSVAAVATVVGLTGDMTEIIVDPDFFPTLDSLGVTPGILGDATLEGDTLGFPITGGGVEVFEPGSVPNYVTGQIFHENSGLTLTAGSGSDEIVVELRNFNVDPTFSRVYGDVVANGQVAATSAYLFRLNGSTLEPLRTEGDAAILEGTQIFISDTAAGLLNDTFGTDAVTDQVKVGVARITVNTGS